MKSFSAEQATNPRLEQQVETIAIIGLGCRFPGVLTKVKAFWESL